MTNNFQVPPWNILLVDDDEDDYLLTRELLRDTRGDDFRLVWAHNLEEALQALERDTYDVALVDYQLEAENGLSVIRQAIQRGYRIPYILLTGHGSYEIDIEALMAGANDFLVKAELNAPLLERAIRYAIEHKHTEETLRHIQNELETRVRQRTQALSLSNEELRAEIAERLKAEAALRASESQLRYQAMLLETVNDAIVAMDENLRATGWNRSAELIYGWKAEEVIGQPLNDLLQTQILGESFESVLEKIRITGQYTGQAVQRTRDGRQIYVEMRATALKDAAGLPIGMVSIQRDITEKIQYEKELAEVQRRLMDSLERERLQIAQELHDGPMQDLYALSYQLEALRTELADARQAGQLQDINQKLQEINQMLRSLAGELRPPALAPFGLAKAIRSHADGFRQAYPDLDDDPGPGR
jgi:two-component system, cell cycle sensor histidine kinase and response regulator CckA